MPGAEEAEGGAEVWVPWPASSWSEPRPPSHAVLGASAEDEVGSGSVRESKMVANGQPPAQLVGGEWQWCVLSLSTPPLQKVLVQAVTQLTLQSVQGCAHRCPAGCIPEGQGLGSDCWVGL